MPALGSNVFGEEVAFDQKKIMPQKQKQAHAEAQTEQAFPLLKLPPELRTMIYEHLIYHGDLSILRVSKLVNQEAVPLVSRVGALRITLGYLARRPVTFDLIANVSLSGLLTLTAPEYIQNVVFHISMVRRRGLPRLDPKLLQCFGGNKITRRTCVIVLILGTHGNVPFFLPDNHIYEAIAAMTGFKELYLILEHERDKKRDYFMVRFYGSHVRNQVSHMMHRFLLLDYEKVSRYLTETLGPAAFDKSFDGHFLGFQPTLYKGDGPAPAAQTLK